MSRCRLAALAALGAAALTACQSQEARSRNAIRTYAEIAHATYADALDGGDSLDQMLGALLGSPAQSILETSRESWIVSREYYGQTEVFRFYGGPIDNDVDGPETWINAWPLDESYIDYVEGAPGAGIINNPSSYPEITAETLVEWNQPANESEDKVATGYHAIEFLLWGQDLSDEGPGDRPLSDFTSGPNSERRGDYLAATSKLLESQLAELERQWRETSALTVLEREELNGEETYRDAFVSKPTDEALLDILTGMGALSGAELAGERLQVALDTRDQEDEHSCFSDNTHRDIVTNIQGIQNVYLGLYTTRVDTVVGAEYMSLSWLVNRVDADLDERMRTQLETSLAAAEDLQTFDQEIVDDEGRERVEAVIVALEAQTATIVEIADALGLSLNLVE